MELLRWHDGYEKLNEAKDERQLFERMSAVAKELGFEYCCYGIRVPLPVSNPSVAIFDTYPAGWMKHYQENNFIAIDPTVRESFGRARQLYAQGFGEGDEVADLR